MRRFVTYLYEYRNGKKEKNVGFLRIDIRGEVLNMEICIKNYLRPDGTGKLYGLLYEECIALVEWADIRLQGGQSNQKFILEEQNYKEKKYQVDDVLGVAVIFENGEYIASCWKDEYAEKIANGKFSFYTKEREDNEKKIVGDIQAAEEIEEEAEQKKGDETASSNRYTVYKKIKPEQIRELPSANWYLSDNSFLKHGVYNYEFLFLKKEMDERGERVWLGVPGYYEKQELLMAMLFGFPEFKPVPREIIDMEWNIEKTISDIEKNQEPKMGIFGGWFVLLDK